MYWSFALANDCSDCTTSTLSVTPAAKRSLERESLIGQIHVLAGHGNLFDGGIQIEKCSANVIINLSTDVFSFRAALPECSLRLGYVARDLSAGKYRNADPCLESERSS